MTRHSHPALAQVRQLGLISENELDDAIAELEILALDEEDDVDMPRLAADATAADALAWLLHTDLLPQDDFLRRVQDLPRRHGSQALFERQQLAADALKLVNRRAIDTLYDEDLISPWQRDTAYASLPVDRLLASPIAALREMLRQGTLTEQQFELLRTRQHGSELGRIIVDGTARQIRRDRPACARPGTWVMAALLVLVLAFAGRAIVSRQAPAPAAPVAAIAEQGVERPDLQRRAAQAVENARVPAAGADLSITVVQDGATPAAR